MAPVYRSLKVLCATSTTQGLTTQALKSSEICAGPPLILCCLRGRRATAASVSTYEVEVDRGNSQFCGAVPRAGAAVRLAVVSPVHACSNMNCPTSCAMASAALIQNRKPPTGPPWLLASRVETRSSPCSITPLSVECCERAVRWLVSFFDSRWNPALLGLVNVQRHRGLLRLVENEPHGVNSCLNDIS
jgi:hypothetical protein